VVQELQIKVMQVVQVQTLVHHLTILVAVAAVVLEQLVATEQPLHLLELRLGVMAVTALQLLLAVHL
jgi:hypothetical protein